MAWDEWEQLKAEAAGQQSVQMQTNQAAEGSGGGGGAFGGVKSDKASWAKAGEGVGSLREPVKRALTKLEQEQKGSAISDGTQSAAAQQELYRSWKRYVTDVRGRCGVLQGLLEKTGNDQYKNDEAIKGAFEALAKRYEDTPPVGGQGRGR